MSTQLVLVHGSWHGAWCWEKIIPLLAREGHEAVALDLPGHGRDRTPPSRISLRAYADSICQVLDAQPEPAVLVGHSMGGVAISRAAELRPGKIKALVFLAAYLLRDGESMFEVAQRDKDSLVLPNLIVDKAKGELTLCEEAVKEIFYGSCPDEDVARARSLLCAEPLAPPSARLKISAGNFGRIPRHYVTCLRDRAISPDMQRQMYSATPCQQVLAMDTDHSPFFSAPEELAEHLATLSGCA